MNENVGRGPGAAAGNAGRETAEAQDVAPEAFCADLEIVNEKGLHARASARFAATVEKFDAEITVSRQELTVDGRSIMGLLLLAAAKGSTIRLCASGPEAQAALAALRDLVSERFGEAQ